MSFNIALSGLNAAQKDLDVTSNNIANVNTTGFKESRAEFGDVYSASIFSNSKTAVGNGVVVSDVAQQFHQGSFAFTSNALDLAISGGGFFATTGGIHDQDIALTRAGAFKLNAEGYMVNSDGQYLRTFPVNPDGSVSSVSLSGSQAVQIPDTAGSPQMTQNVEIGMNLPSGAAAIPSLATDPIPPLDIGDNSTFTSSTSMTIYDSLGQSHIQTTYFVKRPGPPDNTWNCFVTVDGYPVDMNSSQAPAPSVDMGYKDPSNGTDTSRNVTGFEIQFDPQGNVVTIDGQAPNMPVPGMDFTDLQNNTNFQLGGADPTQVLNLRFDNPTQFAAPFEVNALAQDGLTVGRLTGVEIATNGLVTATYSNGLAEPLGKVAMVRVPNEQGMAQIGNTSWKATQASGDMIAGEADTGTFGNIRSGALEQSNVNLTGELVDLITAQRNFQANSRSIEVSNTVQQAIMQIR